jgi:hypothetical protein
MTMDLYGHLLDANLWAAAQKIGDISGTSSELTHSVARIPANSGRRV